MESGDGAELELENGTVVKIPEANGGFGLQVKKVNEVADNSGDAVQVTSLSEDTNKSELIDSSVAGDEVSSVVTENKTSNASAKAGSDVGNQRKKTPKDGASPCATIVDSHRKKPLISQSLSFPSKGTVVKSLTKSMPLTKQ